MQKKSKKSAVKKVKQAAKKAIKSAAKKAVKATAKVKKAAAKIPLKGSRVKSVAKKAVKKATAKKVAPKKAAGKKVAPKKAAAKKVAIKKAAPKPVTKKTAKPALQAKQTDNRVKLPEIPPTHISHGPDMHFIPQHGKNALPPVHEGAKEEQIFHHNEEIALHQENDKVRAALTNKQNSRGIFRNRGNK